MGSLLFFLGGWGFVLQAIAVVHFIRRRPDTYWIFLILFLGWVGALIYIVAEVIPDASLLRGSFQVFPRRRRIRELENALSYACMLTQSGTVDLGDLPDYLLAGRSEAAPNFPTLADVEYDYVIKVLKAHDGNRARAAEVLGIGRATLYRLINRKKAEEHPRESSQGSYRGWNQPLHKTD